MDEQFEIPILGYRVGLDPILGLIPAGGDWAAWVAGIYIVWVGIQLEVPNHLLWRMIGHIALDLVIGYLPGAGDVADVIYKSNRRNVDLLLDHYDAHNPQRTPHDLPEVSREQSALQRYALGAGITVLLTAIAALPLLLIWWLV